MSATQTTINRAIAMLAATGSRFSVHAHDGAVYTNTVLNGRPAGKRLRRAPISMKQTGYIETIKALEKGHSAILKTPEGVDPRRFSDSVRMAVRRYLGYQNCTVDVDWDTGAVEVLRFN